MSNEEFYRDRILWRADKHSLIGDQCVLYPNLPDNYQEFLARTVGEDVDPVLVFWGGRDRWTVLGTRKVCSYSGEGMVSEELDKIGGRLKMHAEEGSTQEQIKLQSSFILVGKHEKKMWAPAGSKLFALVNILLMFPIGGGTEKG